MSDIWLRVKIVIGFCGIFILVFLIDTSLAGELKQYGILPRSVERLPYIFSAPFLHGDWQHLSNNIIGFSIFSFFCLAQSARFYLLASFFIVIVTGLLVWCFGRTSIHIGASGWVFGLWSLSIALAWFVGSFKNIIIAMAVIVFYGGMAHGVLPGDEGVSFESHLFGVVSGILFAGLYSKFLKVKRSKHEVP